MAEAVLIYTLSCPTSRQVRYVGKTSGELNLRYNTHLDKSKHKRTHKECWIWSLKQKGLKPTCEVVDECLEDNWIAMEQYWISQFKSWGFNLTNHTEGGEGMSGIKRGPLSEETKSKLSEAMKGRRTNVVIYTDGVKKKISEAKKKKVSKYSLDGKWLEDYNSISEAAESINLTISSISKTLKNEKYTAGGYRWKVKSV